MSPLELFITVISLCSAGTSGIAIKIFCCQQQQEIIEAKVEPIVSSMEVETHSTHTIEEIITQALETHKRTSKEGTDLETKVDISINIHSINHEERE